MFNKRCGYFEPVIIETEDTRVRIKGKYGESLFGNFISDVNLKTDNFEALDANLGNIDIMKAMLALNEMSDLFNEGQFKLGNIRVVNPVNEVGMHVDQKQLLANFNRLAGENYGNLETNNFANGKITLCDHVTLMYNNMVESISLNSKGNLMNSSYSIYEKSPVMMRNSFENLIKIQEEMEKNYAHLKEAKSIDYSTPEGRVYAELQKAIKALGGQDYIQETRDHDWWMDLNSAGL